MRTYTQLLVDAAATGTYGGYVGDGFTIPWQVGIPLGAAAAVGLWAYKQYLDANYFPAAKLHDWCYTPYGSLIGVTRAEADAGIRDYILAIGGPTSSVDAAVVYAGVRIGGAPYFGTSQTGFNQREYLNALARARGDASGGNIPETAAISFAGRGSTMAMKTVIIFQQTTERGLSWNGLGLAGRQHVGGWSESLYWDGGSLTNMFAALQTGFNNLPALLPARASFLSATATILGVRVYENTTGRGYFKPMGYPGQVPSGDIPQMSILAYSTLNGSARARRWTFRGVSDADVVGGELQLGNATIAGLLNFGQAVGNWAAYATSVAPSFPVFSVDATGLVTLSGVNTPFAAGQVIRLVLVNLASGGRRSGRFVVTGVGPLPNQFLCQGWATLGLGAGTGGSATLGGIRTLYPIQGGTLAVSRVVTRRVGRPFELYRGRRSRRRRVA